MSVPDDLRYSKEHEWVRLDGDVATIGITHFAQDQLGDVVFVELPGPGSTVRQFASLGVVESVKSVSDIFSPLAGKVVAVNQDLDDAPELLNQDPYGKGWFCEMEIADTAAFDKLLDAAGYKRILNGR